MDFSGPNFMSCDELRSEFDKCEDDINKRMLIIDIRDTNAFNRSHLCLDKRHDVSRIKTKMRVMNINPDLAQPCTTKKIMTILSEDDLRIFNKRRDATEVIIIDAHTDNLQELSDPRSKSMRIINALTRFDHQPDDKIVVPIHILEGGFREWRIKYPHFTTDPTYDPDDDTSDYENTPVRRPSAPPSAPRPMNGDCNTILKPGPFSPPIPTAPKPIINKPTPIPPISNPSKTALAAAAIPVTPPQPQPPPVVLPKPSHTTTPKTKPEVKNFPGMAVPMTPVLSLRPALPRSHSSPNVAADGDELEGQVIQIVDRLQIADPISHNVPYVSTPNKATSQYVPSIPAASSKPRFDRTLKPAFNNENLNAIRARLNFGRSPEASGKAISGLQNLGNTCFMNSVIQCLAYAPPLVAYFCSETYYGHINFNSQYGSKGEMAVEFGCLVEKLNSHRYRYIEPKSFRDSVVKHIGFAGNEQQDSHEFMMMLFDKLHHDLNVHAKERYKVNGVDSQYNQNDDNNINIPRATLGYQFWKKHLDLNKSIISDLFEGIFMSTLTCTHCKGQSNTFEVFNCLSLPIPSESRCHLRDCLSHFSNPERIEAAWECPRCKLKREADKKIVICKLPRILIIHLKRFSLDGRWRQKLQTTVDFPLADLNVDCTNVLPQSAYGSMSLRSSYSLSAVVNHYGHLDGGHYTAFCRLENHRWYTFDDSNVSEMKDTDVCGQAAYILFYSAT